MNRSGWNLMVLVVACGPVVSSPLGDSSESGTQDTTPETTVNPETTVEPTTVTGTASTGTSSTTTASDVTTESSLDSNGFFDDTSDTTQPVFECDQFAQDCPRGEKCMPWANDAGGNWNATRCSPIDPDPQGVGQPCTVEGSAFSGLDNCELGAMCFFVDPKTNQGECVDFCQGSEAKPSCDDECSRCSLTGDGILIRCLPTCDPVLQDCGEGEGCYPNDDTFACIVDASDETEGGGATGTACDFVNGCDPGNFCADASVVPGCESTGCCAPFCDVEAGTDCEALLPGTTCTPWTRGPKPFGECTEGTVGACVVL